MNLFSKMKRPGAAMAGIFALALGSAVLLCGAGSVPVENFAPQGPMQSDLNAGGHNLTNIATVSATNVIVSGTLTAPVAVSGLTGAGTGVTSALAKAVNAPAGLVVQDGNGGVLMNVPLVKVNSASTTVLLVGDSTTRGDGVSDIRQGPAPILSTLGFCINGTAVYRWGWSGYTTYSINALNASSQGVNFWTGGTLATSTGTTSPSALAAPYVIIDAGTNDYFGVYLSTTLSTSSPTVTVSRNYYFSDSAGHQRLIAAGDKVAVYSGSGVLAANTTVVSTTSTTITLSANPTTSGAVLLKVEPTPTTSTYHTDMANLISSAHTANASAKVFVATLRPANNTTTPADGVDSQGEFQDNVPPYNTYIRGLTIGGGGANPDGIIDEAAMPEFSSYNAAYYSTDQLHPNFAGNQAIARAETAALIGVVPASNLVMQAGSESVPDSSLSNNVALLNAVNAFGPNQSFGSGAISNTGTVVIYDKIRLLGSSVGDTSPSIALIPATAQSSTITMAGGSTGTMNMVMSSGGQFSISSVANSTLTFPTGGFGALSWTGTDFNIGSTGVWLDCSDSNNCEIQLGYSSQWVMRNHSANHELQFFYNGTTVEGGVGNGGSFNSYATQTSVNGSSAGTATFTEPFQGSSYKKVIVQLSATLSGTATYTFPTAFTSTPLVVNNDPAVTALSATAVTVTGTLTLPRTLVLEGY